MKSTMKALILVFILATLLYSCSKKEEQSEAFAGDDAKQTQAFEVMENTDNIETADEGERAVVEHYSSVIDMASTKYGYNKSDDYILIINTTEQKMYLIKDDSLIDEYIVSTGKTGEGNQSGSNQTPLGYHKIVEKIGDGAPIGTIFVGKKDTGELSPIYTDDTDVDNDPVVTRILSLDGLEQGYNKGGKVDSFNRFIYIHGTHEEGLLGTKTSHGCIRMKNTKVVELFNILPNNNSTIVYITQ